MKCEGPSGKYIIVKKSNTFYKIFVKDIKSIKMRARKVRPPVPTFNRDEFAKDTETEDGSIVG